MRSPRCRCSCRCARRSAPRSPPRAPRPATTRAQIEQSARDYFALAQTLLAPPPPRLLAVGGLSGTGKSLLARALAPELLPAPGAVVLRSDVERKALFGDARDRASAAGSLYARRHRAVYARARRQGAARHCRRPFGDRRRGVCRTRRAPGIAARGRPAPFHGLFLTADLDTRLARVGAAAGRCLRCRRQGRARAGTIRSRRARLARASTPRARRRRRCGAAAALGIAAFRALALARSRDDDKQPCAARPLLRRPAPLAGGTKSLHSFARSRSAGLLNECCRHPPPNVLRAPLGGRARRLLLLHQSLFAAVDPAAAVEGIRRRRGRGLHHHHRQHAGRGADRAVHRRGCRRARAQARDRRGHVRAGRSRP